MTSVWQTLRALRSSPPGLASDEDRRSVFSAALQQSQELMQAARSVGHATSPILLFYGLSQAGRAIAAALGKDRWEIGSHGLAIATNQGAATGDVGIEPRPGRQDAFGVVADALGSETLTAPTTLGAVWASLPEVLHPDELCGGAPLALELSNPMSAPPDLQGYTDPLLTEAALAIPEADLPDDERPSAIARRLALYPTASRGAERGGWIATAPPRGPNTVSIRWRTDDEERVLRTLDAVAEYTNATYYLCPGLGSNHDYPKLLLRWWAALLALSSLARYEPATWRFALDIDLSPAAHAFEAGLDRARERVPELVLEVLGGSLPPGPRPIPRSKRGEAAHAARSTGV